VYIATVYAVVLPPFYPLCGCTCGCILYYTVV